MFSSIPKPSFLCAVTIFGLLLIVRISSAQIHMTIDYDAATGAISVDSPQPIGGLFIASRSGVFLADRPGFTGNRPSQILRLHRVESSSFDLGVVATAGLELEFLLNDFCVAGSQGSHVDTVAVNGQALESVGGCYDFVRGFEPGNSQGGRVILSYDSETGSLRARAEGRDMTPPAMTTLQIKSAGGIFSGDPAQGLVGNFDADRDHLLFRLDPIGFSEHAFGNVVATGLTHNHFVNDLCVNGSWFGGGVIVPFYEYPDGGLVSFACSVPATTPDVEVRYESATGNLLVSLDDVTSDPPAPDGPLAAEHEDAFRVLEVRSESGLFLPDRAITPPGDSFLINSHRIVLRNEFGFREADFGPVIPVGLPLSMLESDISIDAITEHGGSLGTIELVPEPSSAALVFMALAVLSRRWRGPSTSSVRR